MIFDRLTSTLVLRCGASVIASLVCACASSPPVEFLTLDPLPAPVGAMPDPGGQQPAPLQVARVHIPPTLDRQEVVRETAANVLQISDQHRWSAPLDQMIESVLTLDLSSRLPPQSVLPSRAPGPAATRKVVVSIDRFLELPGGAIDLKGAWSIGSADAHYCTETISLATTAQSASYADQVKSMSALIAQLAARIAEIGKLPLADASACPQAS